MWQNKTPPPPPPPGPGVDGITVYNGTYARIQDIVCYVDPETGGVTGVSSGGSRSCPGTPITIPVDIGRGEKVTALKVAYSPKNYVRMRGGRGRDGRAGAGRPAASPAPPTPPLPPTTIGWQTRLRSDARGRQAVRF